MMIESPKVERTGTSSPPRALRSSTRRCSAQPTTAIAGTTRQRPRNGSTPKRSASTKRAYAASTARLPCARLMMPMTLNMNESPQAISA